MSQKPDSALAVPEHIRRARQIHKEACYKLSIDPGVGLSTINMVLDCYLKTVQYNHADYYRKQGQKTQHELEDISGQLVATRRRLALVEEENKALRAQLQLTAHSEKKASSAEVKHLQHQVNCMRGQISAWAQAREIPASVLEMGPEDVRLQWVRFASAMRKTHHKLLRKMEREDLPLAERVELVLNKLRGWLDNTTMYEPFGPPPESHQHPSPALPS